eukprot:114148-Pleurochrysis_carterae.AAC.1
MNTYDRAVLNRKEQRGRETKSCGKEQSTTQRACCTACVHAFDSEGDSSTLFKEGCVGTHAYVCYLRRTEVQPRQHVSPRSRARACIHHPARAFGSILHYCAGRRQRQRSAACVGDLEAMRGRLHRTSQAGCGAPPPRWHATRRPPKSAKRVRAGATSTHLPVRAQPSMQEKVCCETATRVVAATTFLATESLSSAVSRARGPR